MNVCWLILDSDTDELQHLFHALHKVWVQGILIKKKPIHFLINKVKLIS